MAAYYIAKHPARQPKPVSRLDASAASIAMHRQWLLEAQQCRDMYPEYLLVIKIAASKSSIPRVASRVRGGLMLRGKLHYLPQRTLVIGRPEIRDSAQRPPA